MPAGTIERRQALTRNRARDKGTVLSLNVEVGIEILEAVEQVRHQKKWSKRTLVEEALCAYLAAQGCAVAESAA